MSVIKRNLPYLLRAIKNLVEYPSMFTRRHGTRAVSALFVAQMVLGPGWKQEHPGVAIGAELLGRLRGASSLGGLR
jgi:hypothetical protein